MCAIPPLSPPMHHMYISISDVRNKTDEYVNFADSVTSFWSVYYFEVPCPCPCVIYIHKSP